MINPALKENGDKSSVLNSLEQKILENVSSNMTITLIKIEESYGLSEKNPPKGKGVQWKNCLTFNETEAWNLGENIVVRNNASVRLSSNLNSYTLRVNWTKRDKFLKIYSSSEYFESMILSLNDCMLPQEGKDFFIKSIKTQEYIFESGIVRLKQKYDSSYEDVKKYFGVSNEEEFGFSFINSQGITSIDVGKEPSKTSIYSKEIPIIYVNNQSNFASGVLKLKVW
jgi:hypothetical protein